MAADAYLLGQLTGTVRALHEQFGQFDGCLLNVVPYNTAGAASITGLWFIHWTVRPVWPVRGLYRPVQTSMCHYAQLVLL